MKIIKIFSKTNNKTLESKKKKEFDGLKSDLEIALLMEDQV